MADKIRHNNSITNEDFGFSGGFVTAISGYPIAGAGGGGGGGVYVGDNEYIHYKYGTSNTFTVTEKVKDVVDNFTNKVAVQIDAQTYNKEYIDTNLSAKQDVLVFAGNGNKIETINGSAFKVTGYVTTTNYQIDKNNFNKNINYLSASVSGKQDQLIFEYDEDNKVSAINGSALAETTYTPGQYIKIDSNNEISVSGLVSIDEYATYSGDWNDVSESYKTYSGDFLTSEDLTSYSTIEHADNASAYAFNQASALIPDVSNFITKDVNDLTNYYPKTQTSSDIELADAFSSILKYDVTAAAGIEITTATDAGVKTFGISISAEPVVTDTRLSGYNGIAAEPDGDVSGLWNVGLTQDMLNTINGKLDSSIAAQTYQTKGDYATNTDLQIVSAGVDYVSGNLPDISDMATQTWVSSQGYLKAIPSEYVTETELETVSGEITALIPTNYVTSGDYISGSKQYALTSAGWAEVQVPPTFTGVTTDDTLTGDGTDNLNKLGVAWSALSSNIIDSAKSANSAEYITNGVGYSGFDDISAKFETLSSYVPFSATELPIGTNNTATNNAIAIGYGNTANDLGFAVGQSNTALKQSFAFGIGNYANDTSLAIGYENSASGRNDSNQSAVNIAIGYANSAADHAAAFINVCTAENYAFAAGHANSAIDNSVAFGRNSSAHFYSFDFGHTNNVKYYSYAFGRGLHYEGLWEGGSQYGAFVIGGWNSTTSYATTADSPLFIIGNGTNNSPSDGFVVYRDGTVSAKQYQNADGTETINGTPYSFSGVDNIEILPLAATANTANFPNDNVLRFILES